jgi:hypothetical protein
MKKKSIVQTEWEKKCKGIKPEPFDKIDLWDFEQYYKLPFKKTVAYILSISKKQSEIVKIDPDDLDLDDEMLIPQLKGTLMVLDIHLNDLYKKFWSEHLYKLAKTSVDKKFADAVSEYLVAYRLVKVKT